MDEKKQQADLDRILQAELGRQNEKRLEKVRAENDKRAKLLREVNEGLHQQTIERSMISFVFQSMNYCCLLQQFR